jgi:hypothetical protein
MGMGVPTAGLTRSPQTSTPAQGGKGGGRPMPAQGGKGGRPMPTQGGKGGGYPQRDYGYGNQLPPQGGKGGVRGPSNVPDYMQPYLNALPPQGGKGTSQQDYDRFMATAKFSGTPPTYEQFVQNRLNPQPQPYGIQPTQAEPQPFNVQQPAYSTGPQVQQPAPVQQPANPYTDNVAAPQLADTINSLTPRAIPTPQVQQPAPRQFDPRMMRYIQMQQEQQRQQMEQQRRQQEMMMMRLPPRLRQQYMQQGQQPSNLGLGGLGGLFRGMM